MPKAEVFWIVMLILLVGGGLGALWPGSPIRRYGPWGAIGWGLVALLGWAVFGAPIK